MNIDTVSVILACIALAISLGGVAYDRIHLTFLLGRGDA